MRKKECSRGRQIYRDCFLHVIDVLLLQLLDKDADELEGQRDVIFDVAVDFFQVVVLFLLLELRDEVLDDFEELRHQARQVGQQELAVLDAEPLPAGYDIRCARVIFVQLRLLEVDQDLHQLVEIELELFL